MDVVCDLEGSRDTVVLTLEELRPLFPTLTDTFSLATDALFKL